MAWYAYCITEQQTLANGTRSRRPSLLEGVQGVNGATVLAYPSGEFNIVVSEYARDDAQFGEKNVLEHARVVSACFRSGTVLPFRFGTIFDTDEALRQAVRTNRRTFGQSVARLRGKASQDRERRTKARALSVQVHKLFNPLEEEISCKRVDSNGMLIDIAHLIDSKSVEKYQNRYSSAAKQLKNCELLISGPWPPYHFLPGKLRTVAGNS